MKQHYIISLCVCALISIAPIQAGDTHHDQLARKQIAALALIKELGTNTYTLVENAHKEELRPLLGALRRSYLNLSSAENDAALEKEIERVEEALSHFATPLLRSPSGTNDEAIQLSLEDLLQHIKDKTVDIELNQNSIKLTSRRVVLKIFNELFYRFGTNRLELERDVKNLREANAALKRGAPQESSCDDAELSPDETLDRNRSQVWFGEFSKGAVDLVWKNKSWLALRTIRTFTHNYFDEIIPNPKQKTWQKYVELLVPLFIASVIAYVISSSKTVYTFEKMNKDLAKDCFIGLIMNSFFLPDGSTVKKVIIALSLLIPIYVTSAGKKVWDSAEKTGKQGLALRAEFIKRIWSDRDSLHSVLANGLFDIISNKIIDDYVMPQITIPRWLKPTKVTLADPSMPNEDDAS